MRIGINAHLLAFSENYRQAGLSRYIHELLLRAPALDRGTDYIAYTGRATLPPSFRRAMAPNLRVSNSLWPTVRPPLRLAWEQTALPVATFRDRLDILHCPVNVRPWLSRAPAIITAHDLIFMRFPQNFPRAKRQYLQAMTSWSCAHAAHIIAVSEATRKDVIELLGVPPGRVSTIPNGVGEQFSPVAEDRVGDFIRAKGISGRVVLYVGTLEPRKNLPVLITAFARFARAAAYEDVSLVIGGSKGWYYNEIFSIAGRTGLVEEGRIHFLGRVPDEELPLWYNTATVFAYPSVYEGFGLPVLEAMACGAPVVASNTSSLPEVAGGSGILVDPESVDEWESALRRVLDDAALATSLAAGGLSRSREFTWDATARSTVELYHRVAGAGASVY